MGYGRAKHAHIPLSFNILKDAQDWISSSRIEKSLVGDDLLSQGAAPQVPSALTGFTAGFGM